MDVIIIELENVFENIVVTNFKIKFITRISQEERKNKVKNTP